LVVVGDRSGSPRCSLIVGALIVAFRPSVAVPELVAALLADLGIDEPAEE